MVLDILLSLVQIYLTNRQQSVKVNQSITKTKSITCGVPQRSALGPLFFLLYINDIHAAAAKLIFYLLADDTCLFYSSKDTRHLESFANKGLENISNWFKTNKLNS